MIHNYIKWKLFYEVRKSIKENFDYLRYLMIANIIRFHGFRAYQYIWKNWSMEEKAVEQERLTMLTSEA